jgi:D-serine dehydratase
MDSHLPIAGSVKARGGIYEILKHTEDLALEKGLIKKDDSYEKLRDPEVRDFFSQYSIHVGSTGNLGLSIGIISAEIGYKVTVHMSADAKEWKKDLLRNYGVEVVEYTEDYGKAVEEGRKKSLEDPNSYFVDDENSKTLFLGYSVAAKRLKKQIKEQNIMVDKDHPLFVYIPCGVGGAPGGISYGLKVVFKENVHCFFVEPTESPCMLIGMESGLNNKISVQDIGLTGITDADGLAVGRPSGFVGNVMKNLLSGIFTIKDFKLYDYLRDLMNSENIFLEPSACATFEGPANLLNYNNGIEYIKSINLNSKMENATHIVWATGGRLVPEDVRKEYLKTHIKNK